MTKLRIVPGVTENLGRLASRAGNWEQARKYFQQSVQLRPSATAYYKLGNAQFKLGQFAEALASTEQAVALDSSNSVWLFRLGALNERCEQKGRAYLAYQAALKLDPENQKISAKLKKLLKQHPEINAAPAKSLGKAAPKTSLSLAVPEPVKKLRRTGSPYEILEYLATTNELTQDEALRGLLRGQTLIQLGSPLEAVDTLRAALNANPAAIEVAHYLLVAQLRSSQMDSALTTLKEILRKHQKGDPGFGAASFFSESGHWQYASEILDELVVLEPKLATLRLAQGVAHMKVARWTNAIAAFHIALAMDTLNAEALFQLGVCYESIGDFRAAADSYALSNNSVRDRAKDRIYRHGYALNQCGDRSAALKIFTGMYPAIAKSLETDQAHSASPDGAIAALMQENLEKSLQSQDAPALVQLGDSLMKSSLVEKAFVAFEAVTRQDPDQDPTNYFRLALAQLRLGDTDGAIESFLNTQTLRKPFEQGTHSYDSKKLHLELLEYSHYCEYLPLEELVLFESYHGSKIDCNPAAIYRELRENPNYDHLRFAWVVTNTARIPSDVLQDPRVSIVIRGSKLFRRVLATAKYLISNVSFPNYFVRRDGQQYLNTWHGTPLKSMGKDITGGFMDHTNVCRNLIQATHLLAPNEHTHQSLLLRYDAQGLYSGKTAALGTPRIDLMLNAGAAEQAEFRAALGLPDDGKPIVFYAPTWRGTAGKRNFDSTRLINDLQELSSTDYHLVFRAHHLAESALKNVEISAIVVPASMDTYEVLAVSDLLITDYSSIFFDFLPMQRPIVFYAYDLDEYLAERGLYFDLEQMPGEIATNITELSHQVVRGLEHGIADLEKHNQALTDFSPAEDGEAASKAVDFFFAQDQSFVLTEHEDDRPVVLIRHDFAPGRSSQQLLEFVKALDNSLYRIIINFDRAAVVSAPERQELLKAVPSDIQVIMRAGAHLLTIHERWALDGAAKHGGVFTLDNTELVTQAFDREYRRIFGESKVLAAVSLINNAESIALMSAAVIDPSQVHVLVDESFEDSFNSNTSSEDFTSLLMRRSGIQRFTSFDALLKTLKYDNQPLPRG